MRRKVQLGWGRFLRPYYVVNAAVISSYYVVRDFLDLQPLRTEDMLGMERESSILMMLAFSIWIQYHRSASLEVWFGKSLFLCKMGVFALTFACDRRVAAWYAVVYLLMWMLVPQPPYQGATEVTPMSYSDFEDVVMGNQEPYTVWVVLFYVPWADTCTQFTSVFASMSLKFATDRLKFVSVNLSRGQHLATKLNISLSPFNNKELPTVMMFEHGKMVEGARVPPKDSAGKVTPVVMYEENLSTFFRLAVRAEESLRPVPEGGKPKGGAGR